MNTQDMENLSDRLDNVRVDLFSSMSENELRPNEALTLLTSVLVQIFTEFAENNTRQNFTDVLGRCYDAYALVKAEPQGSVQ
jgi:hypothetical protein